MTNYSILGMEEFATLCDSTMRIVSRIVFCFALNDKESFEELEKFMSRAKRIRGVSDGPVLGIIIRTKLDLISVRQVSKKEAEKVASTYNLKYFWTR